MKLTNEEIKKIERMVFEVTEILTDIDNGLEKIKNELRDLETESKNKNIKVVMIGDGELREPVVKKIKEFNSEIIVILKSALFFGKFRV